MGKGEGDEWDDKDLDPRQTQPAPPTYAETMKSEPKSGGCPKCCLRTRDCLMSGECGRALQISSVVAMCGMCIRIWI
ncbi:hypothetical protein CRUP_007632 [Coryphaenoides rupestris]|nr:hypothetical protein CRUP_007632 [Coryphaenoides rupestris]